MLTASDIYHDSINGDCITVGYFCEGSPVIATPTIGGLASHHGLSLTQAAAVFTGATPQAVRRDMLAAMLNGAVGMERREAYALGLCATAPDAAPAAYRKAPDAPGDDADDHGCQLLNQRSHTATAVRPSLSPIAFL